MNRMSPNKCRRPGRYTDDDYLCFCPDDPTNMRKVLSQAFINGWVHEHWYRQAHSLAGNPSSTQEELEALLFKIEESANDCYFMWRTTL
jgi:hypothetical protein